MIIDGSKPEVATSWWSDCVWFSWIFWRVALIPILISFSKMNLKTASWFPLGSKRCLSWSVFLLQNIWGYAYRHKSKCGEKVHPWTILSLIVYPHLIGLQWVKNIMVYHAFGEHISSRVHIPRSLTLRDPLKAPGGTPPGFLTGLDLTGSRLLPRSTPVRD